MRKATAIARRRMALRVSICKIMKGKFIRQIIQNKFNFKEILQIKCLKGENSMKEEDRKKVKLLEKEFKESNPTDRGSTG